MDYKKGSAGKQAKKDVSGGVNAAMAPQNDWEVVDDEQVFQVMKLDTMSNGIIAMLNLLKGTATPTEKVLCSEIINAPGILIQFNVTEAPKKRSFLSKLFSKKPKVKKTGPKVTREGIQKKLSLYLHSADAKTAILGNRVLMARMLQAAKDNAEVRDVLDGLYTEISDLKILRAMIKARFGVSLIDNTQESIQELDDDIQDNDEVMNHLARHMSGKPIQWTAPALKSIYRTYINVPQEDLNLIKFVVHTNDQSVSGLSYNQKGSSLGVYEINYVKGKEDLKLNDQKHTVDANDRDNGAELIPIVTAHELGHIVDHSHGELSGSGKEMRKVSSWVEVKDDPEAVLSFMEASLSGPFYDGRLNPAELKAARHIAKMFLKDTMNSETKAWDVVKANYSQRVKKHADKLGAGVDVDNLVDVMFDESIDSNLFYHCWRGRAENLSCYNHEDAMRGMKRPFHQGYKHRSWYTFDHSRWSDKISQYQYRDPIEEFAETYASFHAAPSLGKKKGEMTPQPLLNWVLKEGLDKAAPNKVSGSSNVKDDGKKSP